MSLFDHVRFLYESELFQDLKQLVRIICILISGFILSIIDLKPFFKSNLNFPPVHNTGSRSNRPQTKSAPSQIGPRSNHCIIMFFLLTIVNNKNGGHMISRSEKRLKHIVLVYNAHPSCKIKN
jgi:hypothetical protein